MLNFPSEVVIWWNLKSVYCVILVEISLTAITSSLLCLFSTNFEAWQNLRGRFACRSTHSKLFGGLVPCPLVINTHVDRPMSKYCYFGSLGGAEYCDVSKTRPLYGTHGMMALMAVHGLVATLLAALYHVMHFRFMHRPVHDAIYCSSLAAVSCTG